MTTANFGTDGIRMPATEFTPELIYQIIRGLADYAGNDIRVLIAGDTRESTEWLIRDVQISCETLGLDYASAGILPTPAINYCFYEMGFDFAIDITASHNPYTDNGIKIFERGATSGQKLSARGRTIIEESLSRAPAYTPVATTDREDLHREAIALYREHLLGYLGPANFSHLHIGLDCANGATSVIGASLFEELGAKVELINATPGYTTEINANCGSTHLEQLQHLVTNEGLDFGIAYDGDGDRCLMIDHTGAIVDGDEIIAILTNSLKLNSIAVTVMANQGLLNWASASHIGTTITAVGDTNVAEAMRAESIPIGGEQSGHIILPGEATGDGILTSLMVAKVVASTGSRLADLAHIITKLPQVIVNLPATDAQKQHLADPVAENIIADYSEKVKAFSGRLLVRPSGTEPLIRITLWGNDEPGITALANNLKTKLGEIL